MIGPQHLPCLLPQHAFDHLDASLLQLLSGDGYILTDEPFLAETLTDRITGARSSDNALQPKSVAVSKIKQLDES